MNITELKNKSSEELLLELEKLQEKLRTMNFKVAQRQLKKVHEIKIVKKNISQIFTLLKSVK